MSSLQRLPVLDSRWMVGALAAWGLAHLLGAVLLPGMASAALSAVFAAGLAGAGWRRFRRLQESVAVAARAEAALASGGHSLPGHPGPDEAERTLDKLAGLLGQHDRLRTQMQALQRQQVAGLLAREMSQDLKNRLTVVLAQLDLALKDLGNDDPRQLHLLHAEEAAMGCVHSLQAMQAFASEEPAQDAPIQLNHLVERLCRLLRLLLGGRIQVVLDLGADLPLVLGRESQLEQALVNLAINARQAMAAGGTLTLRTRRSADGWAVLSVQDTGVGISAELLDRIWQPFFSTRTPEHGAGLGLAATREILQGHGGFIQVESRPGEGSLFSVRLPPAPAAAAEPSRGKAAAPSALAGLRILLAEDEPEIRAVMKELIAGMDAEVVTAVDGEDAWNLWGLLGPFDLLITDQRMPRLNGLQLLGRIRAQRKACPVLVMTGYGLEEAAEVLGRDPHARLLAKPFTVPALTEALHALARAARSEAGQLP